MFGENFLVDILLFRVFGEKGTKIKVAFGFGKNSGKIKTKLATPFFNFSAIFFAV
jgi:hypothetical protein